MQEHMCELRIGVPLPPRGRERYERLDRAFQNVRCAITHALEVLREEGGDAAEYERPHNTPLVRWESQNPEELLIICRKQDQLWMEQCLIDLGLYDPWMVRETAITHDSA